MIIFKRNGPQNTAVKTFTEISNLIFGRISKEMIKDKAHDGKKKPGSVRGLFVTVIRMTMTIIMTTVAMMR